MKKLFEFLQGLVPYRPVEIAVDSTALRAVSYDRRRKALTVQFQSGSLYEYGAVEPATYRELLRAESKGSYFSRRIRNHYPFWRLA